MVERGSREAAVRERGTSALGTQPFRAVPEAIARRPVVAAIVVLLAALLVTAISFNVYVREIGPSKVVTQAATPSHPGGD